MLRTAMRQAQRQPVALLALFLGLSGTSYAAATALVPRKSVGSAQVINHSLLRNDFKRRRVPKAVRGPRGIGGVAGVTGATGSQGARGSSIAVVAGDAGSPPAQVLQLENTQVTLTAPATLVLQGRLTRLSFSCSGNGAPCAITLGLYLDGNPVAHSAMTVQSSCVVLSSPCSGSATTPYVFGIVNGVAAGAHTAAFAWKVTSGTYFSAGFDGIQVGALALG